MTSDKISPALVEDTTPDVRDLTFDDRDEFNRKPIAENIIKLLASGIKISPMVIDGGWGTGKTEFCCKLINLMKTEDSHHVMYVNAFQADHANEPLLTVLAEVIKVIPKKGKKRNTFIKKVLPVAKFTLKTAGKAIFAHVFKQDAGDVKDEFDSVLHAAANEGIDASVEAILNGHVEADSNLKTLQTALEAIAKEKPIVLFIDELDRCKPDFAVHMLEVIKHVFDVKGVQFVLVCNTQQLKASINHCYGGAVDAQRYLDKFLKFTFALPKYIDENQRANVSIRHYENLIQENSILKSVIPIGYDDSIFYFIKYVIKEQNLSLREIETLIRYIEIYQTITENKGFIAGQSFAYNLLRLTGVLLFCFKPELATAMVDKQLDAKDLGNFFGEESIILSEENYFNPYPHQIALLVLGPECAKNADVFKVPNDEKGKKCGEWIKEIFGIQHYRKPSKGYSQTVIQTIKTLSLTNP